MCSGILFDLLSGNRIKSRYVHSLLTLLASSPLQQSSSMGDQGVELKESPPKTDTAPPSPPPPPPPLTTTIPEKQDVPVIPAHTARFARIDNLPRIGRRVSSVEAVKGAPPPKRQSVVVFESPDTPPPTQSKTSWWRNLVMDDDKTTKASISPEINIDSSAVNGGLEERNRNISSASVGDQR